MNATQLSAMRAGRAAQLERQRAAHQRAHRGYLRWTQEESQAYARRLHHGRDSDEFAEADRQWRELLALMPTPPPDHADVWRQEA